MALLSDNKEKNPQSQIRRVRVINNDWDYLNKNKTDNPYKTTAETFVDSGYGREDQMLGPTQVGEDQESRAKQEADQAIRNASRSSRFRNRLTETLDSTEESGGLVGRVRAVGKNLVGKKLLTTVARARAIAINSETMAWHTPLWLTFQLPVAVLNIVTLGAVGAVDSLSTEGSGVIAQATGAVAGAIADLASVVGIDFFEIALSLFMITYILILAFGIISILLLFLQYKLALLNPLSGNGAGLKLGMLLLAFIGYSIPFANLLPFVFLWMLSVAIYPK